MECNEKGEKWWAARSEGEPGLVSHGEGYGFYSGCDGSQWRRVRRETTQFIVLNDCSKTYSVIYIINMKSTIHIYLEGGSSMIAGQTMPE